MPHLGTDVVLAAASIAGALHRLVGRIIDPLDAAVLSITQMHAVETWNVIPQQAVLRGTSRSFKPAVQDALETGVHHIAVTTAAAYGCTADVHYERRYPATINDVHATGRAARAAALVVGEVGLEREPTPSMGSEDFAFMLRERPGCYVWLGNGPTEGGCILHNAGYDFNDAVLPIGAGYWATLVETELPME
jgi:hippurate hydrolase